MQTPHYRFLLGYTKSTVITSHVIWTGETLYSTDKYTKLINSFKTTNFPPIWLQVQHVA